MRVPGAEEEALRDLVRARDAVRQDLMRCRHRLSKLLLRHGIRFDDGRAWTERHHAWLTNIELGWPAAQSTLADAIGAVDALVHRRDQLEREIVAMLPTSPWQVQVGRLRCLRGLLCSWAKAADAVSRSRRDGVAPGGDGLETEIPRLPYLTEPS